MLAFAVGPVIAAPSSPESSGGGWRVARMDLNIDLDPEHQEIRISGTAMMRLEIESSYGPALGVDGALLRFSEIDADGAASRELDLPDPVLEDGVAARVRFPKPLKRGATVKVTFAMEYVGDGYQFIVSPQMALASWANTWQPLALPVPGDDQDALSYRSVGRTTFRIPAAWRSVSNGRLVERKQAHDEAVETWEVDTPVARSFVAGPFSVAEYKVKGRVVRAYRLAGDKSESRKQAETMAAALRAMEKRFGPYPYPSYAVVEIPDGLVKWYASSEQGFIMARSEAFRAPGGNLPLFAHEMAHGWWGNLVAVSGPGSLLCGESLAQYSAVLAIEALEGRDKATEFLRFSRKGYSPHQCAKGYFQMARQGHDRALSKLESGGWQHNLADAKGHWVYHMLRRRVGDAVFFSTLRELIHRFQDRTMTLDDVRQVFIQAAPDKGLNRFFADWLDRPGAPVLAVSWEQGDAGQASVTITQQQEGAPYHLMLDLGLETDSGTDVHTVEIDGRESKLNVPAPQPLKKVVIDPNHRLLIWTPAYGPIPKSARGEKQ